MRILLAILVFAVQLLINAYVAVCLLGVVLVLPFKKLYTRAAERYPILDVDLILGDLNDKYRHFNGFIPFCALVIGAIYSLILLLMKIGVDGGLWEYATVLGRNTTIGSVFGFLNGDLNFTPEAVVSIAVSGALFSACMGEEKPKGIGEYLLRFARHAVYFVAFAHLAVLLSGLFKVVGDWGYTTIVSLYNSETDSVFLIVGKVLLMIVLCYPAVEMCLIAVREYAECIVLCVVYFVLCVLLFFFVQNVLDLSDELASKVVGVVGYIVLFAVDLFRPYISSFVFHYLSDNDILFFPEEWLEILE